MRFHRGVDESLSEALNVPERSDGRIANSYSSKIWMQLENFSAAGIKRLKVLEKSRREVQCIGVSSTGHWKASSGHLLWLAKISSEHKPTMCQPILTIKMFPANNILVGSLWDLFAKESITGPCDTCSKEGGLRPPNLYLQESEAGLPEPGYENKRS